MQCKLKALGEIINNNEFLNSILETEAWKGISGKQSLSMGILDGYAYKLDWNEISRNPIITWTLDGMTKFADKLNWNDFSENRSDYIINEVTLRSLPIDGIGRQSQAEAIPAIHTHGKTSR